MMKLLSATSWVVSLMTFILISLSSCIKDGANTPIDFSLENANQIIERFNTGKLSHHKGELVEGSVQIRSASNDILVITVNSSELKDTTIVYQLQLEQYKDPHFKIRLANAQVLFFHTSLVVNSTSTNAMYSFELEDIPNYLDLKENTSSYHGFGLSRLMLIPSSNSVTYRNDPGDPPPAEGCTCTNNILKECDSGGHGASQCSGAYGPNGTQCSVSCSDGKNNVEKWACCN